MATQPVAPPIPSAPIPEDEIPEEILAAAERAADEPFEPEVDDKKVLTPAETVKYEAELKKLTPLALWRMKDALEQMELQLKLAEKYMACRVTRTYYDKSGNSYRVELSGPTLPVTLERLNHGFHYAAERFGLTDVQVGLVPRTSPAPVTPAATTTVSAPPAPFGGNPFAPQQPNQQGYGASDQGKVPGEPHHFICKRMGVKQEMSNGVVRYSALLFSDTRKERDDYPEITLYGKSPDDLAKRLAPYGWKPEHFTQVTEYKDLAMPIQWTYSTKKNTKGNYYQDFVACYPPQQ